MSLREYAVSRAVQELSEKHETFSSQDIADYIGCGLNTVKRGLKRLLDSGKIIRFGDARNGFRYEVVNDDDDRTILRATG